MRRKTLVATFIVFVAVVYLITLGLGGTTAYYWTVDEVLDKGAGSELNRFRVSGKLVGDSVRWDAEAVRLTFDITGTEEGDKNRLTVVYNGVKPDNFMDSSEVIVEGKLDDSGVFIADTLLVKCPTKYEAEDTGEHQAEVTQ